MCFLVFCFGLVFFANELLEAKRGVLQSKHLLHPMQGLQATGGHQGGPNGPCNREAGRESIPTLPRPHHRSARKDIHQALQASPQLRAFPA